MSKIYKAIWRQNTNVTLTAIGNITIPSIKDIQINVFQVVFWEVVIFLFIFTVPELESRGTQLESIRYLDHFP